MKDSIKVYIELNPLANSFENAVTVSTTSKKVHVFVKEIGSQVFRPQAVTHPERKRAVVLPTTTPTEKRTGPADRRTHREYYAPARRKRPNTGRRATDKTTYMSLPVFKRECNEE